MFISITRSSDAALCVCNVAAIISIIPWSYDGVANSIVAQQGGGYITAKETVAQVQALIAAASVTAKV